MNQLVSKLNDYIVLIVGLLIIAIIIILALTFYGNNLSEQLEFQQTEFQNLEKELSIKSSELTKLTGEKEDLIKQVAQTAVEYDSKLLEAKQTLDAQKLALDNSYTLPNSVVEHIQKNGYATSAKLLETLIDHNDLIPIEGVLGGTMRWWPENSVILDWQRAFGYFEDGHIMGYGLLKYEFDAQGNVQWHLLESYVD